MLFVITKLGHKCLEPAATLKYEPLNSCITVLSIWIMKIFKCYAPKHLWPLQKMTKLWRNKMPVSKCPCSTFSAAMSCLESHWLKKKHQLIVPSTLLAPATRIRTGKAKKKHTLRPLTCELFFQNSSTIV